MTGSTDPTSASASSEGLEVAGLLRPIGPTAAPSDVRPVGGGFIVLYALAYMGTWLMLMSPVLVTLALKLNSLVGEDDAPNALGLVAGVGALLAMFGNPFFGKLSDRTSSKLGMRRPWMLAGLVGGGGGLLIIALADSVFVVLVGWCIAQLGFNALLASQTAVLADQVPEEQRGAVSGVLGVCMPVALVSGSFVVQLVSPHMVPMFMLPVAVGGVFILLFVFVLKDRRLDPAEKPPWSLREFAGSFYVNPRKHPDFGFAWASRFLFILGYAFLTTYQTFYLLERLDSTAAEVPGQVFLGTLVQAVFVIASSLVGGRLSDKSRRRKIFVMAAAVLYGAGLFVIAIASGFNGFLVGMAIGGLGFGVYTAVDLALVTDVLPDKRQAAKDLGVFNIASAMPQSLAPAIAPAILAIGGGSFAVLYAVAAVCAASAALAVVPIKGVR